MRFTPLAESHLEMILTWLAKPHVKTFWTEAEDPHAVREKYRGKRAKNIFGFMVEHDGKRVGYIQHYEAWNVGPGWWPDAAPGVYGLDVMVGDADAIGKGLGTRIVSEFIETIVRPGREVTEVIADPDAANLGAIRMFEKCGFKSQGMVPTPYGDSLLLTRTFVPEVDA